MSNSKELHSLFSQEMLSILNLIPDGIWLSDSHAMSLFVNTAACNLYGIQPKDIIGTTAFQNWKSGMFDESCALQVMENKKEVTMRSHLKNGKELLLSGYPVMDEDNNLKFILVIIKDISVLLMLNQKLSQYSRINTQVKHQLDILAQQITSQTILQKTRSRAMHKILTMATRVAQTDVTVLILGESGVGKENLAMHIHRSSKRASQPFIVVNCGAIPEGLMESEMFGHKKGAFTDARQDKMGLLEAANRGTILLDEIGDMPFHLQVKLLRVLQNKTITKIGDTKPIKLDVRILAATNQNLDQLVEAGKFRDDLFYRINTVQFTIPPLRERIEDIHFFISTFLDEFCSHYGVKKVASPSLLDALSNYSWPGNIRELKSVIENLVIMCPDEILRCEYLPTYITRSNIHDIPVRPLRDALLEQEKALIQSALSQSRSIRAAARLLEINHATLLNKIKKLGIRTGRD